MSLGVQRKRVLHLGLGTLALVLMASAASAAGYKVLHDFAGISDGQQPSELVADSAGRLYGTTFEGGSHGGGTVFRLTKTGKTWSVETLASLSGGALGGRAHRAVGRALTARPRSAAPSPPARCGASIRAGRSRRCTSSTPSPATVSIRPPDWRSARTG